MTDDDRTLMDELNRLGEVLGSFVFGTLTDTLSVTKQLAFGYQLIAVTERIRARVEKQSEGHGAQAGDGDGL